MWVGGGCWYFAEVLVWYLTTHRDLSKIVLLVETCQISRDQTNISQKHQEFQNENFPLNIPCYMRRRRRWRGCWDWQIWVLWWVILWKEENFPAWPPVDQQSNNLTIEDNLSRGGQLTRREGQSHVDLLCHNILSVLRAPPAPPACCPGFPHKSDRTIRRVTEPLSVSGSQGRMESRDTSLGARKLNFFQNK